MSRLLGADERVANPFLADPIAAVPTLRDEWETFHETGIVGPHIRGAIAESWRRSQERHVSPERRAADVDRASLKGFETRDQQRRFFARASEPIVEQLSVELAGAQSAIVVCDDAGRIIDRGGDKGILRRTETQNFVNDAVWNEECAGTNGIGLALALGRPAQVFSAEHFCIGFQEYACTAAPIRHPVTREVLGVLDVTTQATQINHHTYAMVVHAARDIEKHMEDHVFGRERELLERYLRGRVGLEVPFFTVDRSGRTIIQNAPAAELLKGQDLTPALQIVREAMQVGHDVRCDLELARGRAEINVHLVTSAGDLIGAVVAVRLQRRDPRAARLEPAWKPLSGKSPAVRELLRRARRFADLRTPLVIEGEPGVGKHRLARSMHDRAGGGDDSLAIVNCSARGWRREWDAAAGARTILVTRMSALGSAGQLELAYEIEQLGHQAEHPWLIGVVTSGDQPARLELLHRLGPARLAIPPLRERLEDIAAILSEWCASTSERGSPFSVSPAALDALLTHGWPGNVRELVNVLEGATLECHGAVITPKDLRLPTPPPGHAGSPHLRDLEREAIENALERAGGNVTRAADLLGISRATLHRRLRSYRLVGR